MAQSSRISFVTEAEKRAQLDMIAGAFGKNLSTIINEALDQYIDLYAWQMKHIQDGVDEAQRGDFVPDQEVRDFFETYGEQSC